MKSNRVPCFFSVDEYQRGWNINSHTKGPSTVPAQMRAHAVVNL